MNLLRIDLKDGYVLYDRNLDKYFQMGIEIEPKRPQRKGVDSEIAAKKIVRKKVFLPEAILPELSGIEFYDHEIVGFTVIDEKVGVVGVVESVIDLKANPLLQIMKEEKEILIPLIDNLVKKVDRAKKILHVLAPDGLIDLYL